MIWVYNCGMISFAKDFKETEKEFEIFANKNRLAILSFLNKNKKGSVGQIADHLEISFKTASRHLLYLAKKGILKRHYDGPFVLYEISDNLSKLARLVISHLP